MDREHPTNAELESQFNERNNNLRKDISSIVNTATSKTQDLLNEVGQTSGPGSINNATQTTRRRTFGSVSSTDGSELSSGLTNEPMQFGHQANAQLMHSITEDIAAMHSRDPDRFGIVASKFDEAFGQHL
ncbi:hypothetical protein G6F70_006010 [Rhizopus microsporus]|uniref:Uncharacterized protein n=2 Tax=Rhizopus TaxID=4842 RepID=A0A0A1N7G6_RHIZD|nr:hypothetical protein G6F71_001313 [Rhizopus microsporus]KAG1198196.1 hypothetical protein G6F70_006010 [Rhizopus microsporus]KAG1209937.1 hypothetical protein G6F69_005916 [Rhizopus microsporus]KAG1231555.1 hypothetical protein G6F67_005661 [Rhizopus microsporus]KAG1263881.1 hypothetical protein G6F68_004785 [Rhizopus microsporus]